LQNDPLCGIIGLIRWQRKLLPVFIEKEVNGMLFLPREKGQGLVEYALILVLVAIVVIAILLLLGPVIGNIFSNIIEAI
jgi:pilus assembly protein Flp/PilA